MMAGKSPSPQAISALLKRAGFTRSVSSKSRIKGFREHSEGFTVCTYRPRAAVEVDHSAGFSRGPGAQQRITARLAEYAAVIRAAGYHVEDDALHGLIVTASGEDIAERLEAQR